MKEIIEYVQLNWADIVTAIGGIAVAARVIVKLTPTPKDDAAYAKIIGVLKHLGLHIDKK